MKVIGLTGNIGCGKSTVAGWLREMGVAVIDLDAVARQIRNNDAEARRRIEARFGTIEAGKLAPIVFSDPAALRDLEAILHPLVRNETRVAAGGAGGGGGGGGLHRGDQAARVAAARHRATAPGWCAVTRPMRWRAWRPRAA